MSNEQQAAPVNRGEAAAGIDRPSYEPPRIVKKRSVARVTLASFNVSGNPGDPGNSFTVQG